MIKIEVFACSYCKMVSRYKASVKRHEEKYCRAKPRQTCLNCVYYEYDQGCPQTRDYPGDPETRYCAKKDVHLSPFEINENNDCPLFNQKENNHENTN